jgi:hypothetical protein
MKEKETKMKKRKMKENCEAMMFWSSLPIAS